VERAHVGASSADGIVCTGTGLVLYAMLLCRRPFADEGGGNKKLLEQMASQVS
jgi:hypothetical protein